MPLTDTLAAVTWVAQTITSSESFGIDFHCPGFVVTHGQYVDLPSKKQQNDKSGEHRRKANWTWLILAPAKLPIQPIGERRKLMFGDRDRLI